MDFGKDCVFRIKYSKLEETYSLNYSPLLKKRNERFGKMELTTIITNWQDKLHKNKRSS